jgi:hypothetical protein
MGLPQSGASALDRARIIKKPSFRGTEAAGQEIRSCLVSSYP